MRGVMPSVRPGRRTDGAGGAGVAHTCHESARPHGPVAAVEYSRYGCLSSGSVAARSGWPGRCSGLHVFHVAAPELDDAQRRIRLLAPLMDDLDLRITRDRRCTETQRSY